MRLKRTILADVPRGGIVRVKGEWGVVCAGSNPSRTQRIVDFWWDGRRLLRPWTIVEVLA